MSISKFEETHIALAHGNGGRHMRRLIEQLFAYYLNNQWLDTSQDAARLPPMHGDVFMTTDGFTVQPLEFPGGDIGSLAIHGTVNDLAVSGAIPKYLTLNAFLEEGLEIALLQRVLASMASAAKAAHVYIVAGDTKVLKQGEGGGIYFATTGIGEPDPSMSLAPSTIKSGDQILVSGSLGDHGIAVMFAREQFGLRGDLNSDSANVLPLVQVLRNQSGLKFMRDPTRGGLASVCHEISRMSNCQIKLWQQQIPIRDPVHSVCEILGYDPLYLACEGRVVAVVDAQCAEVVLKKWRSLSHGHDAAIIGEIGKLPYPVILETELGGQRVLEELEDDPLPRIC